MLSRFMMMGIACVLVPAPARADELQARVLAAMRATRADAFAFQRTMTVERTGAARKVIVERFDPRRPAADRWSLVSIDGHAPTAKEAEQSRKAKRGPVPSYGELAEWFGATATRADTAPGYVVYRFARLPAGVFKVGSHDASADTQAEAFVNVKGKVPFVERVRMTCGKGFRVMLVASVKAMDLTSRYTMLPTGTVVPEGAASTMTGSMMGKSGQMKMAVTYGTFQPVR